MANTKSAKIANRKAIRRTEINRARTSRIRTFLKKVEHAIQNGNHEEAMKALSKANSELAKGIQKGLLKQNTVSRKVSRLNTKVKGLAKAKKAS